MSTNPTTKHIGKYEVLGLISKGARSAVYKARDGERAVAIRIIPRTLLRADAVPPFRKYAQEIAATVEVVLQVGGRAMCFVARQPGHVQYGRNLFFRLAPCSGQHHAQRCGHARR